MQKLKKFREQIGIRKGIREGRYPHIRTGIGVGKILIDLDLLNCYLEQEAVDSVTAHQSESINYGQLRQIKG